MTIQSSQSGPPGTVDRSQGTLADVVNAILDKGLVVDVFARVSLVGIELLRLDVRVVVASIDTYLRYAEAVGRLDMGSEEPRDLTEVVGDVAEGGARGKTKGALEGGVDTLKDIVGSATKGGKPAEHEQRER